MAPKAVFFFDIDNCLYPKSTEIWRMMGELIDKYVMEHLSLSNEDAVELHQRYYKEYGLAIEGLVRYHAVDALEYNSKVDDALPLERVLKPDPALRQLLESLDRSKVRLWLFTNAYVTHGRRVVKLLGIEDLFDGITYCDYASAQFLCKPHVDMFAKAQREAEVPSPQDCYFVDDSAINCAAAQQLGWNTVHLIEQTEPMPVTKVGDFQVRRLQELRDVFPHLFTKSMDY